MATWPAPEPERRACEIRLRAERKAGTLLAERDKAKGARGNPGGQGAPIVRSHDDTTQTLSELGVSKTQSSRWQQLAAVPQEQFEQDLAPILNAIERLQAKAPAEGEGVH